MSVTVTFPKEYGYVLATATSTFIISTWHAMRVGPFRKAAQIPYPTAYASDEQMSAATPEKKKAMYLFNCAQRAHYNFMENYITFLPALLLAGMKYPVASSAVGGVWTIARILYAVGYTRSDKSNGSGRYAGSAFWFAQFGLYGMVGKMAFDAIMA